MGFEGVLGQQEVVEILEKALEKERVASAYLFLGPEGVGKRLVAKRFSMALNCESQTSKPCGKCLSCRKIEGETHPDVHWITPRGLSRRIPIQLIRDLRREVYLKPMEGKRKVYILSEADKMTPEASNAFLKTLEEPPPHTHFILVSTDVYRLLPTISSRCQWVRFGSLSQEETERFLREKENLDADLAHTLAVLSEGKLGKALRWKEENLLGMRALVLDLLIRFPSSDLELPLEASEQVLAFLQEFKDSLNRRLEEEVSALKEVFSPWQLKEFREKKRADIEGEVRSRIGEILDCILTWYRDILILKENPRCQFLVNLDRREALEGKAEKYTMPELLHILTEVGKEKEAINRNANVHLALDVMFLEVNDGCHSSS